jgi:hypothetical protein
MSDWIKNDVGVCPVSPRTPVVVRFRGGETWSTDHPEHLDWGKFNHPASISAYRVREHRP